MRQRKCREIYRLIFFMNIDITPGEYAVKIIETTTKYLEYYMNLVDKGMSRFERINSNFENFSIVGKMLQRNCT